jgi:hypothetical protein
MIGYGLSLLACILFATAVRALGRERRNGAPPIAPERRR